MRRCEVRNTNSGNLLTTFFGLDGPGRSPWGLAVGNLWQPRRAQTPAPALVVQSWLSPGSAEFRQQAVGVQEPPPTSNGSRPHSLNIDQVVKDLMLLGTKLVCRSALKNSFGGGEGNLKPTEQARAGFIWSCSPLMVFTRAANRGFSANHWSHFSTVVGISDIARREGEARDDRSRGILAAW